MLKLNIACFSGQVRVATLGKLCCVFLMADSAGWLQYCMEKSIYETTRGKAWERLGKAGKGSGKGSGKGAAYVFFHTIL